MILCYWTNLYFDVFFPGQTKGGRVAPQTSCWNVKNIERKRKNTNKQTKRNQQTNKQKEINKQTNQLDTYLVADFGGDEKLFHGHSMHRGEVFHHSLLTVFPLIWPRVNNVLLWPFLCHVGCRPWDCVFDVMYPFLSATPSPLDNSMQ